MPLGGHFECEMSMEISACYCEKCGLLNTHWVIHQGELFECACGSLNARCVGHFFDSSFFGSESISEPAINSQGEKLVSIRQSQISLEFLETICQQFGLFVSRSTLHQIVEHYGKDKYFARQELRNAILWSLISDLDKDSFHRRLMIFRDIQGLASFIRVYAPRVDMAGLWKYLQGINLPLSKPQVRRLEAYIQEHCYVQRRERFLFTEDFQTALEEYKKGYRVIVSDEAGLMGHGGISENFDLTDISRQKEAVEEFTKFCRQQKSKYRYYVDYLSNTK
jgi:hypothetical protein